MAAAAAAASYRQTVGVDFFAARIPVPGGSSGSEAALAAAAAASSSGSSWVPAQLWDVGSGGVGSLQMAAAYLHACDGVLVVHDPTRPQVGGSR